MDMKRRKELIQEWRDRRPEMGVISIKCKETGESFLGISKDTRADFNSNRAKLSGNMHPNKRLTELWKQYGEELEELRESYLEKDEKASKIWK